MAVLHVSFPEALIIFFVTLGPLKAIFPFAQLTQGADSTFRQNLAWRATAIATLIVIIVALLAALFLANWHVSLAAIVIAGGIILFCQAFQMIMQPPAVSPLPPQQNTKQAQPIMAVAQFSLAIPALVTAPGIVAIAGFMAIAQGDWAQKGIVFASLMVIMGLNLITLLNIEVLLRHASTQLLKVVVWVTAVLQATEAAQYIINGLMRLGALPR